MLSIEHDRGGSVMEIVSAKTFVDFFCKVMKFMIRVMDYISLCLETELGLFSDNF